MNKYCKVCGSSLIRASIYDPDGALSLHGGYKEYNPDSTLKEWWICANPTCKDGRRNALTKGVNSENQN